MPRPDAPDAADAAAAAARPPKARGVQWRLDRLYTGADDPRLAADTTAARARAERFAAAQRGRAATTTATALRDALVEYEAILAVGRRPAFYASLLAAADSENPRALDLEQRTSEEETALGNVLVFFELELAALDDAQYAALSADEVLAPYRHVLATLRRTRAHRLAEAEERVMARKDVSGRDAFVQLYDELGASLRFRLEPDGEALTEGEVIALLRDPDRDRRARALDSLLTTFARERLPLTAIMNALLLDHRMECELRAYPDAIAPTHLANEVAPAVVDAMMAAVEHHYPVIQEFFRLKARLLDLDRMTIADVYAPTGTTAAVPFDAARDIVLDAFARFDPTFAATAAAFFDEHRIDAEVRPGKRPGAFCAALGPGEDAWVLASYADTTRDVATIAHELGHGIHDTLARGQTLLNYHPPLVLAETASVFAEMLVTDHLLAAADSDATRRQILVETLDEMYGTVFRQHALTCFELAAHRARRAGRLSTDDLCGLWTDEQTRLLGDAVALTESYRFGWMYIPHFIHSRFYCYSYAFGELFALALFQRYRDRGAAFVGEYRVLLASGGSVAPVELAARLGFDLTAPAFWDGGCAVIRGRVEELRRSL
jgi:oligoendopeptidase F